MDIVLVLLVTSALAGAAVGFRLKALALVPIGLLIAAFAAAVLHANGFGAGRGIATIVACLVLNQAAYILVQVLGPGIASDRTLDMSARVNHAPADSRLSKVITAASNQPTQ